VITLPDPRQSPTLSVEEAGQLLSLGRDAAYQAVRTGELPVLRFGRKLRVPTARVLAMLGAGTGTPAA